MKVTWLLVGFVVLFTSGAAVANDVVNRYIRLAELEIDPRQIDAFTTAVREVGQVSVRAEEGCLVLYAVADSDNPSRVHVFEIYRDSAAYQAHLQTPHFQKFRATTNSMVLSRKLLDATPVSIATKPGFTP